MNTEFKTNLPESREIPRNLPRMVKILDVIEENPFVKTLLLDIKMEALPGQFVMLWLPGIDEKPMSVRGTSKLSQVVSGLMYQAPLKAREGECIAVTVEARGPATKMLLQKNPGDMIGVRGPYGKSYTVMENAILVGGGVGMPPVAFLADMLKEKRILQGARTKNRLMFLGNYGSMRVSTDDGSYGRKGFVTELLKEEMKKKKPARVYTCGPEAMMQEVIKICKSHGVPAEASLERYMRCGLGVCGSCVCGNRVVCVEGPVFTDAELSQMKDFGESALTKSARKIPLREYYSRS